MLLFGYKIVDKEESVFLDIIDHAKAYDYSVELGLYGESRDVCDAFSALPASGKNLHFNHYRYTLLDTETVLPALTADIDSAKKMGVSYAIHHLARSPMTRRTAWQPRVLDKVVHQLGQVEALLEEKGFEIYIENTYEPLGFYHALFERLSAEGFRHLNFCFDIGHAKIWSDARFDEWMSFLKYLQESGFLIHFHLHANRGLRDEHLSFIEMEKMGFDGDDHIFSDISYAQMLQQIDRIFPQARKIFEVKPEYALQNMEWVREVFAKTADIC